MNDSAQCITSQPAIELGLTACSNSACLEREGRSPATFRSWRRWIPDKFGIALATIDGRLWTCGDARVRVHDPVDLQGLQLLPGARAAGPRRSLQARRRRAQRRRVQRHHLRSPHAASLQPDGQRRGDHRLRAPPPRVEGTRRSISCWTGSRRRRDARCGYRNRSTAPRPRPGTAIAPSATCCSTWARRRSRSSLPWISTSGSARSW